MTNLNEPDRIEARVLSQLIVFVTTMAGTTVLLLVALLPTFRGISSF
jgi:hypothetical protein